MTIVKPWFSFAFIGLLILTGRDSFGQSPARPSEGNIAFGADSAQTYKECEGEDLKLYFFLPSAEDKTSETDLPDSALSKPRSAIVFFFGGGWVGGTPDQFKMHARYFKSRGMIAVLADYRTKKSHGTSPMECVADAKSAIRYLRANAKKLGIDSNRIIASGGSAGGHIAAASATLKDFDEPDEDASVSSQPNALVLFNPVFDNSPDQWGHKTVQAYWEKISPAANIRRGTPPMIAFFGDSDKLISVQTAKSFQAKMKDVGSQCDLHIYKNAGHGFFNYGRDNNKHFKDTLNHADKFLTELKFISGDSTVERFVKETDKK